MSKPKTIHTVESLLARCMEEGDCFLWTGYSTNKSPQVHHGKGMVAVRKLICQLLGKTSSERIKYYGVRCGNPMCVAPDHIVQRTAREHSKNMATRAHTGIGKINHQKAIIAWRRANPIKLNEELAAAIRSDTRAKEEVAADYGINPSMVWKIRTGKYWRDLSNPFAGLL